MIWQGAYFEPDEWIARNRTKLVHGSPEIILVSEVIDVTELAASDLGSQASCYVLYDQSHSRFGEEDVVGRVETLKTILSFLVGSPGLTIDDTDFLSDYDKRRIIAWNEPIPDPPVELSIVSAFAAKVEECPDAPAIYAWDGEMTYLELDTASSKVAASLSAAGRSGPHDMVLFNMKKSKWALVAALGILKSGKAIVPTDPSWPQARLDQILGITEACLVVCDKDTKGSFGANRVEELMMPLTVGQQATAGWRDTCSPKDLAFVLFSSGSTGVPKGMLRQHGTACTGSFAHAKAMHLDRTSRVLQFANHVFDVAMLGKFTS
jgi:non-ribosomal peptide synthetase component F